MTNETESSVIPRIVEKNETGNTRASKSRSRYWLPWFLVVLLSGTTLWLSLRDNQSRASNGSNGKTGSAESKTGFIELEEIECVLQLLDYDEVEAFKFTGGSLEVWFDVKDDKNDEGQLIVNPYYRDILKHNKLDTVSGLFIVATRRSANNSKDLEYWICVSEEWDNHENEVQPIDFKLDGSSSANGKIRRFHSGTVRGSWTVPVKVSDESSTEAKLLGFRSQSADSIKMYLPSEEAGKSQRRWLELKIKTGNESQAESLR